MTKPSRIVATVVVFLFLTVIALFVVRHVHRYRNLRVYAKDIGTELSLQKTENELLWAILKEDVQRLDNSLQSYISNELLSDKKRVRILKQVIHFVVDTGDLRDPVGDVHLGIDQG